MNRKRVIGLCLVLLMALIPLASVQGATFQVDGSDPGCSDITGAPYCTIQAAINAAASGDTINVAAGTYAEILSITTDGISLIGADEATVIIDATAATGYHFTIDASSVTVKNFTLNGSLTASYGLKVSGLDAFTKRTDFTIENVTINNTKRTALDINGLDGVTVKNVSANNVPNGVGVALSDVDNAVVDGVTTTNNAWGGFAIYTWGLYYPGGSDNVVLSNIVGNESNPLYVETGNYADQNNPYPVTNLVVPPEYTHSVRNHDHRDYGDHFTFYATSEANAIAYALALHDLGQSWSYVNQGSYITVIADGSFLVAPGMSVQTAVDMASSDDAVNVKDGTYEEQVVIDKNLTLTGESAATVIKAPATVPECALSSYGWHAVVCIVNDADVAISTMTVDGAGRGNSNYKFMGVAYRNAGGSVDNLTVKDIRDTPFSGAQHGVGVNVYNDDDATRTFSLLNTSFTGFQKNAVAIATGETSVLDVTIDGNDVTGAGATDVTAQNGLQVYEAGGTLTGVINNNTVHGIAYDNTNASTKWVASSILSYYAHVDVTNNIVTGGHVGVYNFDAAGNLTGNDLTIEKVGVYAFGIIATDPPGAVPAPYGTEDLQPTAVNPNTRSLQAAAATTALNVNVADNTIVFSGVDNTETYGIDAEAGWGPSDIAFTASGNTITGFDYGLLTYACESNCDTGVFTTLVANNNCFSGNTFGAWSNVAAPLLDATSNFWGDASGPYHPTVNAAGTGDEVSDNVNFDNWLDSCGGTAVDAFHNVTADTYHSTMQYAVDNASPGDVIEPAGSGPFGAEGTAVVNTAGLTINLNGATFGPGSPFLTVAAANVTVNGPGVLDGAGSTSPAILVTAGGDNFTLNGVYVEGWEDGVQVASSVTSFKLVNNFIHDNTDAGLQVDNGVTLGGVVTIEGNLFKDNGGPGVRNASSATLPVQYNSWGHVNGPASGDGVIGPVDESPWTFAEIYLDVAPNGETLPRTVNENTQFEVALKADAANLYGLTFKFTYDTDLLTLDGAPVFDAYWNGKCLPVTAPAGTIAYRCNQFSGPDWDGGTIATISFTADLPGVGASAAGPWDAIFDISHLEADTSAGAIGGVKVFMNNAGFNDASIMPDRDITDANDGEVEITGAANFTGFVDLQGRANDSGATLQVFDAALISGSTARAAGTSSASGAYTTSFLSPYFLTQDVTYWFQVDAPLYLPTTAVQVPPLSGGSPPTNYAHSHLLENRPLTTLETVVLLGGDATDNNLVDVLDATCIGNSYESAISTCGGGTAYASSDVNGDGVVNILDLVLMGGNYDQVASPWTP